MIAISTAIALLLREVIMLVSAQNHVLQIPTINTHEAPAAAGA
jgi:hypothetical protein